ncbi:hypothetical protein ACPX19_03570 [Winogradskyella sp. HB-48]|uniref:hypothetical protein n=1 Tax=Winogradskyella sp. HB-48 TaxID=3416808 RepID=UPI003CE94703
MKKILLSLFILSLLSTTSCNNDDDNGSNDPIDQLPPPTQTGENTIGYLFNGIPVSITNSSEIGAFYQQLQLQIGADFDDDNESLSISLLANGPLIIDTEYSLINNSFVVYWGDSVNCFYDIDDTYQGSMIITYFDDINYIISGTFEFSTVTDDCEIINITEGRFDVQYAP